MNHIFISHVAEDAGIAIEIARGLEKAGYTTWHYERDGLPGPSYLLQVNQAIETSRAVVLIISPVSIGSKQVQIEVERSFEEGKPFVPILRGMEHDEFQRRQPTWRLILGTATSIAVPAGGVSLILPRIVGGLKMLGIQPVGVVSQTKRPPVVTSAPPSGRRGEVIKPKGKRVRPMGKIVVTVFSLFLVAAGGILGYRYMGGTSAPESVPPEEARKGEEPPKSPKEVRPIPAPAPPSPAETASTEREARLREMLKTKRLDLNFEATPLPDVVGFLRILTGVNIVLDPDLQRKETEEKLISLTLKDVTLGGALDFICGKDLAYTIKNDGIFITTRAAPSPETPSNRKPSVQGETGEQNKSSPPAPELPSKEASVKPEVARQVEPPVPTGIVPQPAPGSRETRVKPGPAPNPAPPPEGAQGVVENKVKNFADKLAQERSVRVEQKQLQMENRLREAVQLLKAEKYDDAMKVLGEAKADLESLKGDIDIAPYQDHVDSLMELVRKRRNEGAGAPPASRVSGGTGQDARARSFLAELAKQKEISEQKDRAEAEALTALAEEYYNQANYQKAREELDKALKLVPDLPKTRDLYSKTLAQLGEGVKPATGSEIVGKARPVQGLSRAMSILLAEGVKMDFVLIQPGSFMMGDQASTTATPVHEVMITKPFYMGICEVTQAQWKAVMNDNPSEFKGDDLPVERVSWTDSQEYLAKLREKLGNGLRSRLPTEAEWECACRAGSKTKYSFGDNEGSLGESASYGANSGGKTHPVGQKEPNVWGFYDMHGNVAEWCGDLYCVYSDSAATDPTGPGTGLARVLRGGSWFDIPGLCSSACRDGRFPSYCSEMCGFRVVCEVTSAR